MLGWWHRIAAARFEKRVQLNRVEYKTDCIELNLNLLLQRMRHMAIDLTKLNAGVAAIEGVVTTLRQQNAALTAQVAALTAQVGETPADQAAVDAVGDKLTADAAAPAA